MFKKLMTSEEFVKILKELEKQPTLYVMGGFGQKLTPSKKEFFIRNYAYNKRWSRKRMIRNANVNVFAFDCVNVVKGILWGCRVNKNPNYCSNTVPDYNANGLFKLCENQISIHDDKLQPGCALWMPGHFGIYIGDGKVIESTPAWENGLQITNLTGERSQKWRKAGFLPWLTYDKIKLQIPQLTVNYTEREKNVAKQVIDGYWGNGENRKKALKFAGWNYDRIQDIVNSMIK